MRGGFLRWLEEKLRLRKIASEKSVNCHQEELLLLSALSFFVDYTLCGEYIYICFVCVAPFFKKRLRIATCSVRKRDILSFEGELFCMFQ